MISEKYSVKIPVWNIKYSDSDNGVDNGVLILKHPIVINRSSFEVKIEEFNKVNRYNRDYDWQISNEYFSYTVFEGGEIVSFNGVKSI